MLTPLRLTTLGREGVAARAANLKVGLWHYRNDIYRSPAFSPDYDNKLEPFLLLRDFDLTSLEENAEARARSLHRYVHPLREGTRSRCYEQSVPDCASLTRAGEPAGESFRFAFLVGADLCRES